MNFNIFGLTEAQYQLEEIRRLVDKRFDGPNNITGIMITGPKGSGKTTILHGFLDSFDWPKFTFEDDEEINEESIENLFYKASLEDKAIVYIDDFDLSYGHLVVNEMSKLYPNVLVVATRLDTALNEKHDNYLFGKDAFNKDVILPSVDYDLIHCMIYGFFNYHNLPINDGDFNDVVNRFSNSNYQEIMTTLNTAYASLDNELRVTDLYPGKAYRACQRTPVLFHETFDGKVSYRVCTYLAAKILMATKHLENTTFKGCYFKDYSNAVLEIYHNPFYIDKRYVEVPRFDKRYLEETKIKIAMVGYLNELLNYKSLSGENVIEDKKAISDSLDEIIKHCYVEPKYEDGSKNFLKFKRKLFNKYQKQMKEWVKINQFDIKRIADHLYEFKEIKFNEVGRSIGFSIQGQDD